MNDGIPLHRKFGYDHMLEMADIRATLSNHGITGPALHFRAVEIYEGRHASDPTWRERQQDWLRRQRLYPNPEDPMRAALESIRDGHNDPRGLAREVLALLDGAGT